MGKKYLENYLSLIREVANKPETIETVAKQYLERADYSVPADWLQAHALCQLSYQIDAKDKVFEELYDQLFENSWFLHSSMSLDDEAYAEWFRIVRNLNDKWIERGGDKAFAYQFELMQSARESYRDRESASSYLEKGLQKGEATCMAIYGHEMYNGSEEQQGREEAWQLLEESKKKGCKLAELLQLRIAYGNATNAEEAWKVLESYHDCIHKNKKGLFLLADYYLQVGEDERALQVAQEGMENHSSYCQYLLGLNSVNGRFAQFGKTQKDGVTHLKKAFDYGVPYAGFTVGYLMRYGYDKETPDLEGAKAYFEQSAAYGVAESNYELALLYLYTEEYRELTKGMEYLEKAISNKLDRAYVEKAYLLLEHPDFRKDVTKGQELLEEAVRMGNDQALYRLGLGYQNAEFVEKPDYQKALELFEKAATQNNLLGLEAAAGYYKYGYASDPLPEKAVEYYQKAVEMYDSDYSKVELALCYERGLGVSQDLQKAATLYETALANNYPYAAIRLGYLYEDGHLTGQEELEQAFDYYKIGSEADIPEGSYQLARCYRYKIGCEENPKLSVQLFQKAAEAGYVEAHVDLALAYEDGYGGLEASATKALEHLIKAAEHGIAYAQYKLGSYYSYGYAGVRDLEKGKMWFEKAVENNSPLAALALGDYYLYGYGEETTYEKAFDYYEIAEKQGFVSEGIGVCHEFGIGVERDLGKAFRYYKLADERGYDAGTFRLGMSYYFGTGVPQDRIEAFYHLKRVADIGNLEAASYVGSMLLKGDGVEKDTAEGVRYLKESAEAGFEEAQYELGNCYLQGKGVEVDEEQALHWYQKAAENGHMGAQKIVRHPRKRRK